MDNFKWIVIAVILFFIAVNTSHFWSIEVGIWLIPLILLLVVIYLCFLVILFIQIFKVSKEKSRNNKRLYTIFLLTIVLFLTAILPKNPNKWEGENLLVATNKGAASCSTTLRLKPDGKFKFTAVCFGIEETRGTYQINGDTVFFEPTNDKEMYTFGIIRSNDTTLHYAPYPDVTGTVRLYRNRTDSINRELYILTNNL